MFLLSEDESHGTADELDVAKWLRAPLDQLAAARRAFRRFGKGRHRAGLNLGDCFSYALARVSGEPLLFKGEDFSLTDIARVDRRL
jgi:uncharacterized protein with PIN domain